MRIANIVSPGAEYLQPGAEDLGPGVTAGLVVTTMDVPMASDPLRLALKDLVYVAAAVQAERDGFDAVFVNTVADYGVGLMRAAVSIPVAGAGESAVAEAAALGDSFTIVTVWPSSTQLYYDRMLRDTGATDRCREIRYVLEEPELGAMGGGVEVMHQADRVGSPVADRVLHACQDAAKSGVDSIVLGCTCMTGLVSWLQEAVSTPIVSPLAAGVRAAERAVRSGGSPAVTPNPDTVGRVLAAVAAMAPLGASVPAGWSNAAPASAGTECGDVCATLV